MAKHKPAKMLAVLGRCHRTGRWRIGTRSSVLAVLGACRLDMRASFVEDDQDQMKMKVTVVLGSAVFILPEGAEVRPSGMSLLAGSLVDVPEHAEKSGLPTLDIEWTCILGRLQIVTGPVLDELTAASEAAKAAKRASRKSKRKKGRKSKKAPIPSALLVDLSDEPANTPPARRDPAGDTIGARPATADPVGTVAANDAFPSAGEDPGSDAWAGDGAGESAHGDLSPERPASGGFSTDGDALPPEVPVEVPIEVPIDGGADAVPVDGGDDAVPVDGADDVPVDGDGVSSGGLIGEAWRSHDWGDGGGDDAVPVEVPIDGGDDAVPVDGADGGVPVDGDGASSGGLIGEAWRSHDWGDGDSGAVGDADTEFRRRGTDAAEPAETSV